MDIILIIYIVTAIIGMSVAIQMSDILAILFVSIIAFIPIINIIFVIWFIRMK